MRRPTMLKLLLAVGVLATGLAQGANAGTVKVAVGQRGNWDTAVADLGNKAGIFKKQGP
jgi:NitT/TauT family transport system substrate-binding protein